MHQFDACPKCEHPLVYIQTAGALWCRTHLQSRFIHTLDLLDQGVSDAELDDPDFVPICDFSISLADYAEHAMYDMFGETAP